MELLEIPKSDFHKAFNSLSENQIPLKLGHSGNSQTFSPFFKISLLYSDNSIVSLHALFTSLRREPNSYESLLF